MGLGKSPTFLRLILKWITDVSVRNSSVIQQKIAEKTTSTPKLDNPECNYHVRLYQ